MTTTSHNGANRATRRVMEGKTMNTNPIIVRGARKSPRTHAPVEVTIPSGMSETAFLRRFARKGATIVTDKNGRRVEIGHAVRAIFAPTNKTLGYAMVNRGVIGSTATLGQSQSDILRGDASEQ